MCATCPCPYKERNNDHGDRRNITASEFRASALDTKVAPGSISAALSNARRKTGGRRRK